MSTTRRRITLAGAVLLAAVLAGCGGDEGSARLTVTWDDSEGHPGCVYDAATKAVHARLTIEGKAPDRTKVTVIVGAYADENTSIQVGTSTKSVDVEGAVHEQLAFTIPVDKPPHVGEDDVAACKRSVTY